MTSCMDMLNIFVRLNRVVECSFARALLNRLQHAVKYVKQQITKSDSRFNNCKDGA